MDSSGGHPHRVEAPGHVDGVGADVGGQQSAALHLRSGGVGPPIWVGFLVLDLIKPPNKGTLKKKDRPIWPWVKSPYPQ